jgi:hypothetical protein
MKVDSELPLSVKVRLGRDTPSINILEVVDEELEVFAMER